MTEIKRVYLIQQAEAEQEKLRQDASKRREALTKAGCSTYALGLRNNYPSILCLCCGLGSHNPSDIQEKYCGFCHAWHSEWNQEGV